MLKATQSGTAGPGGQTHLIIVRAAEADVHGCHAEVRIGYCGEPDEATLLDYRAKIAETYERAFNTAADRIGVAVLPWVAEIDGDDDDLEDE